MEIRAEADAVASFRNLMEIVHKRLDDLEDGQKDIKLRLVGVDPRVAGLVDQVLAKYEQDENDLKDALRKLDNLLERVGKRIDWGRIIESSLTRGGPVIAAIFAGVAGIITALAATGYFSR